MLQPYPTPLTIHWSIHSPTLNTFCDLRSVSKKLMKHILRFDEIQEQWDSRDWGGGRE